jgi:hypothetical protein
MGAATSRSDYTEFHRKADRAAARLILRYRLSPEDRQDLRQELLVDLLLRLKSFDPCRGTLGAFSEVVIRHGMARLASSLRDAGSRHAPVSLDDPIAQGDPTLIGDMFSEEDGYLAWMGAQTDRIRALEDRLSLGRAFTELLNDDVNVCLDLVTGSIQKTETGPSRATQYRRLKRARLGLLVAGIGLQP